MKSIKTALTERWYVWEDARKAASKDPEIDLNADLQNPAYKPKGGIFEVGSRATRSLDGRLS